jgi:hypothetical protein
MQKASISNIRSCGDKIGDESQGVKSTVQRSKASFSVQKSEIYCTKIRGHTKLTLGCS